MTRTQARLGVNDHLRVRHRSRRDVRALRWKYRLYDLQHPTRWHTHLWCALWLAWWVLGEAIRPQN